MNSRRKKLPITLEEEEQQRLISIPQKRYPTGLRNKAILKLMLNTGIRVSEATNLKPGQINLTKHKLRVVDGKNGVDRDLTIREETAELLKEWKKQRPGNSKYFFCTLKGNKLSERYLVAMVKRYGKKADIKKVISPHTLRHTFATRFYKKTKDIETLRKILGHAFVSTTSIYVTLANIDVENAMNGLEEV